MAPPNGDTDKLLAADDDEDFFLGDMDDDVELAPRADGTNGVNPVLWDPTKRSKLHRKSQQASSNSCLAWLCCCWGCLRWFPRTVAARPVISATVLLFFGLLGAVIALGILRPDILDLSDPFGLKGAVESAAPIFSPYSTSYFREAIAEQRFFCDRMYPMLRELVHLPQSKFPLALESDIASFGKPHLNMYLHEKGDLISDTIRRNMFWDKPKSRAIVHELQLYQNERPHLAESDIVFIDIGANVGWFSMLAASKGFRVVAFEPLPSNELAMRMSICLNNLTDRVILFNKGLSSAKRECPLFSDAENVGHGFVVGCGEVAPNGTKMSTGYLEEVREEMLSWDRKPDRYWPEEEVKDAPKKGNYVPPWGISAEDLDWFPPRIRNKVKRETRKFLEKRFKFKHRGKVELVRLDDVMFEFSEGWGKGREVAVIKMDVEGHEPAVLAGGVNTMLHGLTNSHPKLVTAFSVNALGGDQIARSYASFYFESGYRAKIGVAGWRNETFVKGVEELMEFVEALPGKAANIYFEQGEVPVVEVPQEQAEAETDKEEAVEGVPTVPADNTGKEEEKVEEGKELESEAKEEEFVEDAEEVQKPNEEGIEAEEKVEETTEEKTEKEENEAGEDIVEEKPKPPAKSEQPAVVPGDVNAAESEIGTAEKKTGSGKSKQKAPPGK